MTSEDYGRQHRNPWNLLLHAVTVPLFLIAVACSLMAPFTSHWASWWGSGVFLAVYSALLQRFGHSLEADKPARRGVGAIVGSFLWEQFVAFPRFVLSRGFSRSWRRSGGIGHRRLPGRRTG